MCIRDRTEAGRLLDSAVEHLVVRIDDLAEATVKVEGRAKGPGATMWQAFQNSPAGRALGEELPDLRIDGAATLNLDLAIPLDPRPNPVSYTHLDVYKRQGQRHLNPPCQGDCR